MTYFFCAIAGGDAPAQVLHDDPRTMAIVPLRPMTPTHVLLFPRAHFDDRGYRLAWNVGPDTAQTIAHPHLHLLGGRRLRDSLG